MLDHFLYTMFEIYLYYIIILIPIFLMLYTQKYMILIYCVSIYNDKNYTAWKLEFYMLTFHPVIWLKQLFLFYFFSGHSMQIM